jgi:hypothetical protein
MGSEGDFFRSPPNFPQLYNINAIKRWSSVLNNIRINEIRA